MKKTNTPSIYIIHENQAWVDPLIGFLEELGTPYTNWFINEGVIDPNEIPPEGIFYNRMSASSHTRGNRYAVELTETILAWLERHNRKVLNGRQALTLEVRKSEQLLALQQHGFHTPRSLVANNPKLLLTAAKQLNLFPFIVKPNRGGKGLGVKLYNTLEQLEADIEADTLPETLDGVWLVQQYVQPVDGRITRVELIGGKFYYAVSVDASGGFELCPADACNVGDAFCPADGSAGTDEKFKILDPYPNPDIPRYENLFKAQGIDVGALEYVTGADGHRYIYDINTNTNYNSGAEAALGNRWQGMRKLAETLHFELIAQYYKNRIRVA